MKLIKELCRHFNDLEDWYSAVGSIYYSKTLNDLLQDCRRSLVNKDGLDIFLFLPRLERFAIDYYSNYKSDDSRSFEERTRHVVEKAFNLEYFKSLELLDDLSAHPLIKNNLNAIVCEPADNVTLTYLYPKYINDFYKKIKHFIEKDALLISLAHGATRAGIALELGLKTLYLPIRLSMHKKKDDWPHINKDEFLNKASGKRLFVFDEDCATGITLYTFKKFLNSVGFDAKYGVIGTVSKPKYLKPDYCLIEIPVMIDGNL